VNHRRRIAITGFMGSGKTSVAQLLAKSLNVSVIDLDREITKLHKHTPAELISKYGETAFRELEGHTLEQVVDSDYWIVALGGGAWTVERNRQLLASRGFLTIWLDVSFEDCWSRINSTGGRPLAQDREQARALFAARQPIYRLADLRVEVPGELEPLEVAHRVEAAINNFSIN